MATEEFYPKNLLRNQNEIDFIKSHIQTLHHLKTTHLHSIVWCCTAIWNAYRFAKNLKGVHKNLAYTFQVKHLKEYV